MKTPLIILLVCFSFVLNAQRKHTNINIIKRDSVTNGTTVSGYTHKDAMGEPYPIICDSYYFVDTTAAGGFSFVRWLESSADQINFTEIPGTRDTVATSVSPWDTVYRLTDPYNAKRIKEVVETIDSTNQAIDIKVDLPWSYVKNLIVN
jgi:hypothetical protein